MRGFLIRIAVTLVGWIQASGCGQMEHQGNCGGGYLLCDYACADPMTDPRNCGACGLACLEDEVCDLGICRVETQAASLTHAAPLDIYILEYIQPAGQMRTFDAKDGESCGGSLQGDWARCGHVCANLLTDRGHCGECFNACPGGLYCRSGACTSECPAGLNNCSGRCVNLRTVRLHCGACNRACASDEVCDWGECVLSCSLGLTACDGSCVNLRFDRENCGECGRACATGAVCENSICSMDCGGDLYNCGGVCVDLMTDRLHCGQCGYACQYYEDCVRGTCGLK